MMTLETRQKRAIKKLKEEIETLQVELKTQECIIESMANLIRTLQDEISVKNLKSDRTRRERLGPHWS